MTVFRINGNDGTMIQLMDNPRHTDDDISCVTELCIIKKYQ